jgi:hypothetical protein
LNIRFIRTFWVIINDTASLKDFQRKELEQSLKE